MDEPLILCLVGNKSDLTQNLESHPQAVVDFASSIGASLFTTSAASPVSGVEAVMRHIATELYGRHIKSARFARVFSQTILPTRQQLTYDASQQCFPGRAGDASSLPVSDNNKSTGTQLTTIKLPANSKPKNNHPKVQLNGQRIMTQSSCCATT